MDEYKKIAAQIQEIWTQLSVTRRWMIATALMATLAVGVFFVTRMGPEFGILFRVSDPEEAGEVAAALESAKIPYRLSGGGSTIEVPREDINRARILLAQQKLPHGGSIDFRIYDDPSPGWTRNTEKINFQRAMQGELERTISALSAVRAARVHLTLPERASFRNEQVPPSASVTLRLERGRKLSEANIQAISHLVAASVERLEASEVVIVDTQGRMLSRTGDNVAGPTLDYKGDLEKSLESKVRRLLEPIVGMGRLQVSVQTQIDFSQTHTQEEFFDPEQIATREESAEEVVDGQAPPTQAVVGGAAGAISNQPNAAAGQGATRSTSTGKGHRRTRKTKSYEVNRTVVETQGPKATLKNLTISVLVDGKYVTKEGEDEPVYTPRSPEDLQELQKLVENAVGYSPTRGDRITVANKQFLTRPRHLDPSLTDVQESNKWLPYAIGGGVLLVIGAGLFFRMRAKSKVISGEVFQVGTSVSDAQAALERGLVGNQELLGPGEPTPDELAQQFRGRILTAAEENPERAAEVIRAWIHDRPE